MSKGLAGASIWESELHQHLTSHEERERTLLSEYQDAAEASESPAFRYLAALIVEDEIRHHRLFRELAAALEADVELRSEQPEVPRLDTLKDDTMWQLLVRLMEMDTAKNIAILEFVRASAQRSIR
jgi:hypothetical protein